jgi:hypothetical protein
MFHWYHVQIIKRKRLAYFLVILANCLGVGQIFDPKILKWWFLKILLMQISRFGSQPTHSALKMGSRSFVQAGEISP